MKWIRQTNRMRRERRTGVLRTAGIVLVASLACAFSPDSAAAQSAGRNFALDLDRRGSGSSLLAAQLPAGERSDARRLFDQMLVAYREIERKLGLGRNAPAGAIAALVAGYVAAFHDSPVSDAALAAVVQQVERAISAHPRLLGALRVDRAPVAEQMAILGMMMMTRRGKQDAVSVSSDKGDIDIRFRDYFATSHFDIRNIEITEMGLCWKRGQASGLLAALVAPSIDAEAIGKALPESTRRIEMVAFRPEPPGGWVGSGNFDFEPALLLRSGDAVRDIGALSDRRGLGGHRRSNPETWTRWRRSGDKVELKGGDTWVEFAPLGQMQRPLPKDTRLAGSYSPLRNSRLRDRSNDELSPFSWSTLRFDRSGRFSSRGGTVSSAWMGRAVAIERRRGSAAGTYLIDGFMLTLRRDDGQVELHSIVPHPTNLSFIWVDGIQYARDP